MYVRGWVDRVGRHVSVCGPAPRRRDVCQTTDVPPLPARTMFVASTSRSTFAERASTKWTIARSRKPSPFGVTVVSSGRSPANGADPFVTCTPCSAGEARASAARATTVTRVPSRLQFPYDPLNPGTIERPILTFMRRLVTFALLALALALPAGVAARTRAANDGTLSIKDARGVITIQGRGG